MIVKDEAHCIARALRSVRPYISSYSISVDSRTTDDTAGIVHRELEGIPGVLQCDAWVDFATNRNLAMSRATGDYCLTIDADEILNGQLQINGEFDAYQIKLNEGPVEYWSTRVCRNDGSWKWEGEVHESLHHPSPVIARLMLASISTPHDGARDLAGNKAEELLKFYEHAERTPRNVFYHAQTLCGMGRLEEAIKVYSERCKMGGWAEEVYYSAYQAGVLKAKLRRFDAAIVTLLKAWEYRPSRYEALVWACMLLRRRGDIERAYEYACHEHKESQDVVFVEQDTEWRLYEERALAASALGMDEEAAEYFGRALALNPPQEHIERLTRNYERAQEVAC